MKHIPHTDREMRTIHIWKFFDAMRQEANIRGIIEAVEEIQKFAHNTEALQSEGVSYLLRFNQMAFERVEALELSTVGEKQFYELIEDYRHNMEWQLRSMTLQDRVSVVVSRYQHRVVSWCQKILSQKNSD